MNRDRNLPRATLSLVRFEARDMPAATLPDLTGFPTPASNPTLLPDFDLFAPPVDTSTPVAATPDFGEWTKTGGPDRTLAIAGDEFSTFAGADTGKDTQFLTYGQTSAYDGALRPADIQRLDGPLAAVTFDPASTPNSLYFV